MKTTTRNTEEKTALARFTGQRLRTLRQRKKMTLQQVANNAKTYHANVVKIEQGKSPLVSFYMLLKILRGMGSSLREFDHVKIKTGKRGKSAYSFKNRPVWEKG